MNHLYSIQFDSRNIQPRIARLDSVPVELHMLISIPPKYSDGVCEGQERHPHCPGIWTNGYYDDECWMTLALMRAYDLTCNSAYLDQAKSLYADVETGWDLVHAHQRRLVLIGSSSPQFVLRSTENLKANEPLFIGSKKS